MTRSASPKLGGYVGLASLGLLAALALGLPELVAITAPFALVVALGLVAARVPELEVSITLSDGRALEGDDIEATIHLASSTGVTRLELFVSIPPDVRVEDGENPVSLQLAAGEERDLRLTLRCTRWGAYRIGDVFVRMHDRFGLLRFETRLDRRAALKVFPRPENARRLLRPHEPQVFAGNQVARQKSDGIEFADLRAFVPGDRVRRINWRASARRGELWVNEQHPERNADVVVFVDAFAEARRPDGASTLDLAARATAGIVEQYLRERDRVGFVSFGGVLNWLLPGSGLRQLYRILNSLLDTQVVLSYAWKGLDVIPRRTLPPRALILALTPLLDERSAGALLDLRARGFDLVVVDLSPLAFVGRAPGVEAAVAYRIWSLRREALRARFEAAGVPVAVWDERRPLAGPIEEVRSFRRFARQLRV